MLNPDAYETIQIDKRANGVAVATLNRPDKLNAADGIMHNEMMRLSLEANLDPEVKVLVITGAGRAFCAGGDFGGGSEFTVAPGNDLMREGRMVVDNLLDCEKPVISAVNGYALGLGATLSLLADVVVAGRSAVFADTHVNMGVGAGDGGQVIWPLLMGVNRAKYFLMTGERVDAEAAERMGLVNFVVDDDKLMERALEIADRLASGPSQAISASKVPMNKFIKMVSNLVLPLSLHLEQANFLTDDAQEARAAFQEKRDPKFTGR